MRKKGIHPEWHDEAKVFCNGEEVLTTSGTKSSYTGARWRRWRGKAGRRGGGHFGRAGGSWRRQRAAWFF